MILIAVIALPNAFAEINVDVVLDNLKNPWELEFAPDGKIFFTERDGKLWMIDNESALHLIAEFPASNTSEGGLLGLELDPKKNDYKKSKKTRSGKQLKKLQVDWHVYKDGLLKYLIECKTYLDACYLKRFIDAGKIREIGLSNETPT